LKGGAVIQLARAIAPQGSIASSAHVEPSASASDLLTGGSINGRGDRRDPLARYHGRSTGIGWCGLCHRLDRQRISCARRHCRRLASRHL